MSETTEIAKIENTIMSLFKKKTPKTAVKYRPGAGNMKFPYVEVGYVVSELNRAFNIFWDWQIKDKGISQDEVWVLGDLTIKGPNGFFITKSGFGGSKIKSSTSTGKPLSIGNDLKAASSNALKKAASLLGIAADLSFKELDQYEELPDEVPPPTATEMADMKKDGLRKRYFGLAAEKGIDQERAKNIAKKRYGKESFNDLDVFELEERIASLEQYEPGKTVPIPTKEVSEEEAAEIFGVDDVKKEEEKEPYINTEQDCLYPKCDKGEGGGPAKRIDDSLFCSIVGKDNCRDLYQAES